MNKIKLEPSKDLAYILGVLYSDGCVKMYNYNNRPYYIIIVKTKDKIFAENVYNALKNIGLNVRIYISNGKYYEVESHSKMFVVWFLSLTLDDLLKIVDGYEKDFIRGFYEGDGNLSYRTKNGKKLPQIRFFNSNYKIIKLVRDLLIKLGYHPTPIRVYYKSSSSHRKKDLYFFAMYREKEINMFLNDINPCIKRGEKRLKKQI